MTDIRLKKKAVDIVNPTGRFDIDPKQVVYAVQPEGLEMRFKLRVLNWMRVIRELRGSELCVAKFKMDNGAEWDVQLGSAKDVLTKAGDVSGFIGSTMTGVGFDPVGLALWLVIKDPSRNEIIVAQCSKPRPDEVVSDIEMPEVAEPKAVSKFARLAAQVEGILDLRRSPYAQGKWSVALTSVAVPTVFLGDKVNKSVVTGDLRILSTMLTGALRDIVTRMVFAEEEIGGEPWFNTWKRFVCDLAAVDTWDHFVEEGLTAMDRFGRIDEVVAAFCEKHFSDVDFGDLATVSEED